MQVPVEVSYPRMTATLRLLPAVLLFLTANASGQVLSSPLGTPSGSAAPGASAPAIPHGQGAGVHSPLSPFAPLPKRTDVVPWSVLTDLTR